MRVRTTITTLAVGLATALVAASPAAAHVTAQPPEQVAGGFTTVTLRVPNERPEPTVKLQVQFPESITSARVMPVPGWTYEIEMVKLDEPIEGSHGEEITERIESITWTGGKILDGEFQEFPLSLQMATEGDLGNLVFFPAIQTYEGGEEVGWTERPESADDDTELERPAPTVTLVEGDGGHGSAGSDKDGDSDHDSESTEHADSDEHEDAEDDLAALYVLSIAALAIALLALLLGWKRRRDA